LFCPKCSRGHRRIVDPSLKSNAIITLLNVGSFEVRLATTLATLNPQRPAFRKKTHPSAAASAVQRMESALKLKLIFLLAAAIQLVPDYITGALADGQTGIASIYSTESGSRTASGRRLDPGALTAAHRSLPFGSQVRVTNRSNGRSVVVTVIDRGPFVRGRIIDVTPAAARALGFSGTAAVTLDHE